MITLFISFFLFFAVNNSFASESTLPCDFYGYQSQATPLIVDDVITVKTADGIERGSFTVSTKGEYGFLTCPGAKEGDQISFFLNGEETTDTGTWTEGGTVQVNIAELKDYEEVNIHIDTAYNSICLPVIPIDMPTPYKASQFMQSLIDQGLKVTHMMQWDGDRWIPYRTNLPFTDFNLNLDWGMVVFSENVGTWTVKGKKITLPKSHHLDDGWNSINLPTTVNAKTAEDLAKQINDQGGTAEVIMWWDTERWISYTVPLFFTNHDLGKGKGYFIRCKKDSEWQIQ